MPRDHRSERHATRSIERRREDAHRKRNARGIVRDVKKLDNSGQEEHVARAICSCSDVKWRDLNLTDKKMLLGIARAAIAAMEDYDGR